MKRRVNSAMQEPDLSLLFVRPLNELGIRYIISGSVAAILYGEPRLTHDVDLIIFLRHEEIGKLLEMFPEPDYYLPPPDVIAGEMTRESGGHFNIIHNDTGFKADLYLSGRDEFHAWAFRNARRIEYKGHPLQVAPPEYVIVRKLEYYREGGSEKHVRDVRAMLAVSKEELNRSEMIDWIKRCQVEEEWEIIQKQP